MPVTLYCHICNYQELRNVSSLYRVITKRGESFVGIPFFSNYNVFPIRFDYSKKKLKHDILVFFRLCFSFKTFSLSNNFFSCLLCSTIETTTKKMVLRQLMFALWFMGICRNDKYFHFIYSGNTRSQTAANVLYGKGVKLSGRVFRAWVVRRLTARWEG